MATTSELQTIEGHPCLEFASSDIGDSTVGNKVFTTHDGDVYIKLTTEGKTNCLNAAVSTISKELCLEVGELVLSRNTYNVNFCLMDARIYNQRVIVMTTV
ncbi:hypothetical protein CK203_052262 [Vitis vinifera]|uniref:Calcium-mediated lectin domain-containing protein n=1 Tax=Vitis vinifera TaxID=29760 RepID=A0A438FWF3_VITVI|nr:hypothetical protein CK203_052262 [Vitis vinifera]